MDRLPQADAVKATHRLFFEPEQGVDENDTVLNVQDCNSTVLLNRAEIRGVLRHANYITTNHVECLLREVRNGTNT
jgi:hypothetical protein